MLLLSCASFHCMHAACLSQCAIALLVMSPGRPLNKHIQSSLFIASNWWLWPSLGERTSDRLKWIIHGIMARARKLNARRHPTCCELDENDETKVEPSAQAALRLLVFHHQACEPQLQSRDYNRLPAVRFTPRDASTGYCK